MEEKERVENGLEIAIIGMSCRFPGGDDIDSFWKNLKEGKESILRFSDKELLKSGIDQKTLSDPNYVKAGGVITETQHFDLNIFNYSPKEAQLMDPQLKLLHECAWEALENSGYSSEEFEGLIGTYIGGSTNLYWMDYLYKNSKDFLKEAELLNSSHFFSTRLSHKLNLQGPSYTVQTACSSSLVAVHLASQALLSGDCDISLAGGVSLTLPEIKGYKYQDGMILSPDGKCKPFDNEANGTVNGNGAGFVVLKRLEEAISDRDHIYAVIKGSAINNDGANKVSYTAPSIEGQSNVIKQAHHIAEVEPESISYVEAHGTGTKLGDPIEIEALRLAFNTNRKSFCGIGSVKSNIGHLDNAAGIAGLIKTAKSLQEKVIPPMLHFNNPNKNIDFSNSPFYINKELTSLKDTTYPLRAGVSSFGIGGTNAHVVLEEAQRNHVGGYGRKYKMIYLSAQTKVSFKKQIQRLTKYLMENELVDMGDLSYTLIKGRRNFKYRLTMVVSNREEALKKLEELNLDNLPINMYEDKTPKKVVFMFPGQGNQYINMGLDLYRQEKIFKDEVDRCIGIYREFSGIALRSILYPSKLDAVYQKELNRTAITQPIMFIIEYALAKLLMHWGIQPSSMIGHSLGEYVAACLSGVFTLEDGLKLVYHRATLMQSLPEGQMVNVVASKEEILPLMDSDVSIALENSPSSFVISGSFEAIDMFTSKLEQKNYMFKILDTSHAFHSKMMNPILKEFKEIVKEVRLDKPKIPFISNVTGKWVEEEVLNPNYWVDHLRETVKYSEGLNELLQDKENIYIEVGPGRSLSTILRKNINKRHIPQMAVTMRHSVLKVDDNDFLLRNIAELYTNGVGVNWNNYFSCENRGRIPLPTYPFDRKYYSVSNKDIFEDTVIKGKDQQVEKQKLNKQNSGYLNKINRIIEVYQEVTGVESINSHDDFFELGGDSLTAVNAVSRLQTDLDISINKIFEYPKVSDLARNINFKDSDVIDRKKVVKYLKNRGERHHIIKGSLDKITEKKRIYEIENNKYAFFKPTIDCLDYQNILLTGGTGYLGIYLLRDLLLYTEAAVHVIVRANNLNKAIKRIKEKVTSYFGLSLYEKYEKRIIVHVGNLTEVKLGLSEVSYSNLAGKIQSIIHAAGDVSHFGNYHNSYKANVLATNHLIDFSFTEKMKDFNYMSTLAVASGIVPDEKDIFYTENDGNLGQEISNPYPKTKLEAEKQLFKARIDGLNVKIFRIGNIVCDSVSGKFQDNAEQNAIYSILNSYIEIGMVPRMKKDTDLSYVDDISKAVICLFNKRFLMNETFHIYNPEHISFSDILTSLDSNFDVKETSLENFVDYIFDKENESQYKSYIYNLQLHGVGSDLSFNEDINETIFHIASKKTNMLLEMNGFKWKGIESCLIEKMMNTSKKINLSPN
ncbi:type I polyketide synthase [Priestia filamentosa]|nr:type I polyketide synthase [Priestia filamentosa]MDT3762586.1 type I polyketide synthase [Priestia filamentosa]OXS69134.1 beta-ketoacyl synthase [Priestia filamentosa]WCM17647.1 type I polyketide synthase [Priestia filamentosa]SMF28460.1 thioester reductase domain-containing protein [Priestia filamentosa]